MVSYFPPPHSLCIVCYINIAILLGPYQFPKWTLNAPIKPNPKTKNTNPKLNWYISPQCWAIFQFVGLDTTVLRSQWMLLGVPAAIWHATFFCLSHSLSLSLSLCHRFVSSPICALFSFGFSLINFLLFVWVSKRKEAGVERGKVEVEIVDGLRARGKRCVY